nr:alpha/beta fold hydrolase [uncultured Albidiferax sp.]
MQVESRSLAVGGHGIAMRVYLPDGPATASVVIGGAMGVRQDYYAPFAHWLAAQGLRVTTFDYQGMGDSLPAGLSLRQVRANLLDWAADYEAVVAASKAALPAQPLYLLGHSLGGQLPGFFRDKSLVAGLVSMAAGSGYWRENAPQLKRTVLYFWYVLVPLLTRLCGYFPGRRLKKVGNLPAGVILQWRKWCLHPGYGAAVENAQACYAQARFPVLALSVVDDELMTLRGTESLVGWYANAPRAVQRLDPADWRMPRIGHFGFFRAASGPTLWPLALQALQQLPGLSLRSASPL